MKIANFLNVCVSYGDKNVLNNITLAIEEKEHTVILGANGSGKSTLIKLFSNDIYPKISSNSYKKVFDKDVWNIFELKNMLGIVTNDMSQKMIDLAPQITIFEAVLSSFYSSIGTHSHQKYTNTQHIATHDALRELNIWHLKNKPICETSTGELRKTVIARALVHNPKALLLDEPTTGLDIKAQIEFVELIRTLAKNKTIILITHHIEEIFEEIKQAILLKNGEIFKSGKIPSVLTSQNLSELFDINLLLEQSNNRFSIKKN
ncbi:MAG: hypothetical protein RL154_1057 [Pseudomonadota bacterium]|jgi:iron complex transport system ATP-binding protein